MVAMIRFLLFAVALAFCSALSAQDVIFTRDGREIQAKVLEVGTEEIVYRKWNNPDGPEYHLRLSDILEIRYENGDVESYAPSVDGEAGMVRRFRGQVGGYDTDLYFYSEYPEGRLYRSGALIMVRGVSVSPGAVLDSDLYDRWRSGESMRLWGMASWATGSGLLLGALPMALVDSGLNNGSLACILTGGLLVLVGVPLHVSGNSMLESVVDEQNARREPGAAFAPSFNFGAQRHGIGFALNF